MDKELEPTKMETKDLICADCVELEDEVISESFICCVCLDLLYKPTVLACGHVSCFWCVRMSMNNLGESSCPVCRHPYHHFPSICEMLHLLIVKMYPNAYHRRDSQMLEQEEQMGSFSPKVDINSLKSNSIGESAFSSVASSQSNLPTKVSKLDIDCSVTTIEENNQSSANLNQISITNVLCPTCKKMLFRPAVLNCGHAFCETCITISEDEIIICSICELLHPSDLPKVCLELNNFLEQNFPKDYVAQKDSIDRQQIHLQRKPVVAGSGKTNPIVNLYDWLAEHDSNVHIGMLCDYCGMLPIVGTRYKCKDCKDKVGFDLCEGCYNTQSKQPARFNQQHTEEHRFEVMKTAELAREMMLRAVMGSYYHGLVDLSAEASEEFEADSLRMGIDVNPQENTDNNEDDSAESNEHILG